MKSKKMFIAPVCYSKIRNLIKCPIISLYKREICGNSVTREHISLLYKHLK